MQLDTDSLDKPLCKHCGSPLKLVLASTDPVRNVWHCDVCAMPRPHQREEEETSDVATPIIDAVGLVAEVAELFTGGTTTGDGSSGSITESTDVFSGAGGDSGGAGASSDW